MRIHHSNYIPRKFRGDDSFFRRSTTAGKSHPYYAIPVRKGKETLKTSFRKNPSRVVKVVGPKRKLGKESSRHSNNYVKPRYSRYKKHFFELSSKRPKTSPLHCPNAPHNTTSYLMNFHRDEIMNKFELDRSWTSDDDDDNDLTEFPPCHSYGSFFGAIGDSYEIASQISAPQ